MSQVYQPTLINLQLCTRSEADIVLIGVRRDPGNGRPVWFNGLLGRHGTTRETGDINPQYIGNHAMTRQAIITNINTAYANSMQTYPLPMVMGFPYPENI